MLKIFTKYIKALCYAIIIFLIYATTVHADYLPPGRIGGQQCYNLYDVAEIKKGTQKNLSSLIYGKGTEFYINNCFIRAYENSIIYYLNNQYKPIEIEEFSSNGNVIKLPANKTAKINANSFYLTKELVQDFFEIDIESEGILYEKEKEENKPLGVEFSFLENNLYSLGYQYMGSGYYYEQDGVVNNYVFFHDDSITIQWYYTQSEEILDLLLQALFPNSYILMKGNIGGLYGDYDNRHIEVEMIDDYVFIEISNKTGEQEESTEETPNIQYSDIYESDYETNTGTETSQDSNNTTINYEDY